MGPKWLRKGPEKGQGRTRSENVSHKGDPRREKNAPLEVKKRSKSIKNVFENIVVFKSLSGSMLESILHQHGTQKGQI